MESVLASFSALSLTCDKKHHESVDSFKSWIEVVKALDSNAGITKTLLLKPGKGPNKNLILVVSLESTALAVNALAKALGYKDARMASDDLATSTLSVDKINCTLCY